MCNIRPVEPTARSLILDLLSTLREGAMPVAALVAAGGLFRIPENRVRVALARLLAAGLIERDERARYRLGAAARAVHAQVASWRRVEERLVAWEGGWLAAHTADLRRAPRTVSRRGERALRFLGFRSLTPGLALRPDNLKGGAAGVRETLHGLGLSPRAPVFALRELDPESEARTRGLWDGARLRDGYRRTRSALERSVARLPRLSPEAAMVETFRLGGAGIRQLVFDPLLPPPLVDVEERRALVAALRDYDRLGRDRWAAFLSGFGVPHRGTPLDLRTQATALEAAAGGSR
jgi:phenylacetic acid degradation operon negative regulatory protein